MGQFVPNLVAILFTRIRLDHEHGHQGAFLVVVDLNDFVYRRGDFIKHISYEVVWIVERLADN